MLSPIQHRPVSRQFRTDIVQAPAIEHVLPADYTAYTRLGLPIDPTVVADKLTAARSIIEKETRRAFMQQTWDLFIDLAPGVWGLWPALLNLFGGYAPASIELPKPPLQAVIGIYITDDTGNEITVDPSAYWVSRARNPGRIALRQTAVWPGTAGRTFETFRVRFTAGYSDPFKTASNVLTTPAPHGYLNGQTARVYAGGGTLPTGLTADTDYFVVNETPSTLQLSTTPGGSPITLSVDAAGGVYLGQFPSPLKRGILAVAVADSAPEKKKTTRYDVAEAGSIPDLAREQIRHYILKNI